MDIVTYAVPSAYALCAQKWGQNSGNSLAMTSHLTRKVIVFTGALIVAGAVMVSPLILWHYLREKVHSSSDASIVDWVMGPTMILWGPLAIYIAVVVAQKFAQKLWPKRM